MKILYVGEDRKSSTSRHRADALRRLGHEVILFNPSSRIHSRILSPLLSRLHFHTGYRFVQKGVRQALESKIQGAGLGGFDVVWVNNGEMIGPTVMRRLSSIASQAVLYINDDPTGGRDGRRFDSLIAALPAFDLAAVVRTPNEAEFYKCGVKNVCRIFMSYDEVAHSPLAKTPAQYHSEVAFIGTWMRHEDRHQFLAKLIEAGINVSIWGGRWQKAPNWKFLQPHWRGGALAGNDYVGAIQGAKICLGLLSKGNRDLHTRRSVEIPYAGGLLCGERTPEHLSMYRENEEAVFWSSPEECIDVCKRLLAHDGERERIRRNGMRRIRELRLGNEDVCQEVLDILQTGKSDISRPFYAA
jgi:hypothetical protein